MILLVGNVVFAQNVSGLTGISDTSFSNVSEWRKQKTNYPDIQLVIDTPDFLREQHGLVYIQRDDSALLLDVFYPMDIRDKTYPAILIIHGGGWRSGDRSQHHPLARKLAGAGFVCFTVTYRLSTEALYPAALHDVKAAVKWIRMHAMEHHVNEDGITALGFSAGGQLATLLGATNGNSAFENATDLPNVSSVVQAVVNIDGIASFVHPEAQEGSAATLWFGFMRNENEQVWTAASPLSHVGRHTPPTLFINSGVVRMRAGRDDYINVLNQWGIYNDTKVFPDAPHSFCLFEPWFTPTIASIVNFLGVVFGR